MTEQLAFLDLGAAPPHSVAQLKWNQMALLNSTLLHELYFASIGGDGRVLPETIGAAIERDFGSVARWRAEFVALATALAGGSGWVLLTYVPRDGRLMNQAALDHNQAVAGGIPILALDMYEHAYHIEFGANATAYIAAYMRNIDWAATQKRFADAINVHPPRPLVQEEFADVPSMTVEEVRRMLSAGEPIQVIDARPRHYSAKSHEIMAGAIWRDPEHVATWMGRAVKVRAGRHVLCLRLPRRLPDGRHAAGGRIRRVVHVWRPFFLEGDQRGSEAG